MKFMFETTAGGERFSLGGPLINLNLTLGKFEIGQRKVYSESERSWTDDTLKYLELPFVFENAGPSAMDVTRLEFCAWRSTQLLKVYSRDHWYHGESALSPGTMFSDRAIFDGVDSPPDRVTGQVTIKLIGQNFSETFE